MSEAAVRHRKRGTRTTAQLFLDQVRAFEAEYLEHLRTAEPGLLVLIVQRKAIDDELAAALRTATKNFTGGSRFAARSATPTTTVASGSIAAR